MNDTTTHGLPRPTSTAMTGFMPGPHCGRGTLDIIWSCLSTTILAIWVSIHLDVDVPHLSKDSSATKLRRMAQGHWDDYNEYPLQWRKVITALSALILPEPIVADAINEFFDAWRLRNVLISSGISGFGNVTLRQAFFIRKGGIWFEDGLDGPAKLTETQVEEFARTGRLELRDLPTDEQIADRSKSDLVLKSISVFQTLWFIANIIYRLCAGLQVSLLEDLTAAWASCGIILFTAWFRCPQDVCQSFIIQLRSESDTSPQINVPHRDAGFWTKDLLGYSAVCCAGFSVCTAMFIGIHLAAWNYPFATLTERWLWRSCSLAILPLLGLVVTTGRLSGAYHMVFLFSLILYGIARLILISLALAAFRKAPVGIYKDASWTDLIPHI